MRLVAQGRTDRAVAAALGITERTAIRHVARILQQLRRQSRVPIGVWAATHGLDPST